MLWGFACLTTGMWLIGPWQLAQLIPRFTWAA
jgi:hypothetical protein